MSNIGPSVHGGTTTYDIFVGGLPALITKERMENYFSPYGNLHSVLVRDSNRGMDEKIAFVRFLDEMDAQKAVNETNNTEIEGNKIVVKRSAAKARNPNQQFDGQKKMNFKGRSQMMGEKPDLVKMGRPQQSNFRQMGQTQQQPQMMGQTQQPTQMMGQPQQLAPMMGQPQQSSQMMGQPQQSSQMMGQPQQSTQMMGQPLQSLMSQPPQMASPPPMNPPTQMTSQPQQSHFNGNEGHPQISHWQSVTPAESTTTPEPDKPQGTEQLIISYIDGPNSFWGQTIKNNKAQELMKLSEDLGNICPLSQPVSGRPSFSKVYGALFSEDGGWYRCKPLSYVSETMTLVQYIDYGNNEMVENNKIVEIPNTLLAAPAYADKYVFHGLEPTDDDTETTTYKTSVTYLKEVSDGQLVEATTFGKDAISGATAVEIQIGGISVTDPMVEKGHLRKKSLTLTDHLNLKGPRNVASFEEQQMQQSEQRPKGAYPLPNIQRDAGSGWGVPPAAGEKWGASEQPSSDWGGSQQMQPQPNRPPQAQNQMQQNRPMATPRVNQMQNRGDGGMGAGGDSRKAGQMRQDTSNLQTKIDKANREINKLQNEFSRAVSEKDAALLELGTLKGRMKLVTEECATVTKRAADLNISTKLKTLMATVNKVKLMRLQFPTGQDSQDLIQIAIDLVLDTNIKISPDMQLIQMVQESLANYNECQRRIKQCQDVSELEDLISKRNVTRKVLYEKIEHFLQETKSLPVEARGSALRQSINHLKLTYASFKLGSMSPHAPLNEVIHQYQMWRARKNSLYTDVRSHTNTAHIMLDSSLKAVQELLSLDFIVMPDSKISTPDLDGLVNRLQTTVQREMELSDLERSGDAPLIARTLTYLINDMMAELKNIDQLAAMQEAYSLMKDSLVDWLDDKPDMTELQARRKHFKGLKSKLRHKLADKHDVEESDEDKEDLIRINLELTHIRLETHAAFLAEDEEMVKLAKLFKDHFPELCLQHPELSINKYVEYGGVVKAGLDIDQFELQPLPCSEKSSVYQTVFNGEKAILKEFILDDALGIVKDEFLARVVSYNERKCNNLLKVEAVFFHKNKRQVYLLLKQHTTLASQLEQGAIDEVAAHKCLLGVMTGLAALHQGHIIHGVIKTENILLDSEGNGILAEYDFTKSVGQRACSLHMSPTGLIFNAPETRVGVEVSKAVDIFSFGVLLVQLHFPRRSFQCNANGCPILEHTRWPQPMLVMVDNLLSPAPAHRISAKNLLTLPYFTDPCEVHQEPPRSKSASPVVENEPPASQFKEETQPSSEATDSAIVLLDSSLNNALETPLPESDLGEEELDEIQDRPLPEEEQEDSSEEELSSPSGTEVVLESEGLSQAIPDVVTQAADVPTVSSTDDDGDEGDEEAYTKEESDEIPQLPVEQEHEEEGAAEELD